LILSRFFGTIRDPGKTHIWPGLFGVTSKSPSFTSVLIQSTQMRALERRSLAAASEGALDRGG
jgi:hypothetical protein